MKHIFTFFAILFSVGVFAQKSNLIVFNNTGQQFFVILNGIRQNSIPQTNVKVEGLNPTSYKVKIIFADGVTGDIDKNVYLEPNMEYSAQVVIKSASKRSLKLYNMVALNASPYGGNASVVTYRSSESVVYSDQQVFGVTTPPQTTGTVYTPAKPNLPAGQAQQGTHTHADGTVHDHNHQPVKPTSPTTHTHSDGTVHDHNHQPVKATPVNGTAIVNADGTLMCRSALDNVDYVISGIKDASFSSDQVAFVQEELALKCISSDQAYRIVNAFTFDGDRIKISKFCYDHMTDKANASKLLDLFSFSSSKDELRKYFKTGK